jgi:hypothetical protein
MTISQTDLDGLERRLNDRLQGISSTLTFTLTVHFKLDRVNDLRNVPPITLVELGDIFDRFISQHMSALMSLQNGNTFNIRCKSSHINMPCAVEKKFANSVATQKNVVITVMRKKGFKSNVTRDFEVS